MLVDSVCFVTHTHAVCSMGGHGALMCALKNPDMYTSVSAFAPIVNPTQCPWGEKAFTGYLGSAEAGAEYDATELMYVNESMLSTHWCIMLMHPFIFAGKQMAHFTMMISLLTKAQPTTFWQSNSSPKTSKLHVQLLGRT